MNKGGLVAEVAKRTDRGKTEVARIIEATMATIRETVARGERVSLVGFGTFEKTRRNERLARNPRKPEISVKVPARDVPRFTPGQAFRDDVAARSRRTRGKTPTRRSAAR